MPYLVDTDICSAHLRNVTKVTNRFLQYTGQLHLSVLSLGEMLSWTLRAKSPPKYHKILVDLLADVSTIDVDSTIAHRFGEIRANLLDIGQPVASIDLVIGATAIVHGLTLVTHNVRHFAKIPGLVIEDWLAT